MHREENIRKDKDFTQISEQNKISLWATVRRKMC